MCGTACNNAQGYFKSLSSNDNQCITCSAGSYGDDTGGGACLGTCATGCSPCFNNDLNSCFGCTGSYYLQPSPGSTTCDTTCPVGYYGDGTSHTCKIFSMCSSTCQANSCSQDMNQSLCTACSTTSGFLYLSNSNG